MSAGVHHQGPPRSIFDLNLGKNSANYAPLTPIEFLQRSAQVFPNRIAIVDPCYPDDLDHPSSAGPIVLKWSDVYTRCRQMASVLVKMGVQKGDAVATFSPNCAAAYELNFSIPMSGGVVNAINSRLDAAGVCFILRHSETKLVFCHVSLASVLQEALKLHKLDSEETGQQIAVPPVIYIHDPDDHPHFAWLGHHRDYEATLLEGDRNFSWVQPHDEWDSMCLNYTSGTTGNPKGVVYSHRGCFLEAVGLGLEWGFTPSHPPSYLWTLPMFHCTGWIFPYAVAMVGGLNVILRKVRAKTIYQAIQQYDISHICGAPTVLDTLVYAKKEEIHRPSRTIQVMVGGAPPPDRVFTGMRELNFNVLHIYGLTETYGPGVICEPQLDWISKSAEELAAARRRQGVRFVTAHSVIVANSEPVKQSKFSVSGKKDDVEYVIKPVPADGKTSGEVLFRGNNVMKGYLKNPRATAEAFDGGWFHTGDVAVVHPDGYIQITDRSKDIIISGGENISSIEVQTVIARHHDVLSAAVVAMPHDKWGETPCAFVELKPEAVGKVTEKDIIAYCREHLAHFKCPRRVVFGRIAVTPTGKVQKFKLRDQAREIAEQDGVSKPAPKSKL